MKKRLLLISFSLPLLVLLWWRTGWSELWDVCRHLNPAWFAAALVMFIPQTVLSGARWSWIVRTYQPLGLLRAIELVLASSTLSVVLPFKLGDVAKGAFLHPKLPGGENVATGLTLALFEKGLDLVALALLMLGATVFAPPTELLGWLLVAGAAGGVVLFIALLSQPAHAYLAQVAQTAHPSFFGKLIRTASQAGEVLLHLRTHPGRFMVILMSAILLWILHLVQFSLALRAAGGTTGMVLLWSRIPMAIFVGLLPVTFAGVGTRDAAILYFLGPTTGTGVALALGVFATLRYLLVVLAGLPCIVRLPVERIRLQSQRFAG